MKNKFVKLLALFLSFAVITSFSVACAPQDNGGEQTPPEHAHDYSTEYSFDENYHWLECECGEKTESETHSLIDGKCSCGYEKEEEGKPNPDSPEHTHDFNCAIVEDKYLKSKATCTKKAEYYYSCECGEKGEDVFECGKVLDHSFTDYKDNDDNSKTAVCDNGCGMTNTIEKDHVHDYKTKVTNPTCEEEGYTIYSCLCGHSYTADYVDQLNHSYGEWGSNGDGTHTRECANDSNHKETKSCTGGKPTCENKAMCDDCNKEYGSALGHDYGEWINNEDGTHTRTCKNDDSHKETDDCEDNGSGVCALCGATLLKLYVRDGDKIYFGSYPQTEVTDSALKSTLNGLAGALPTSSDSGNWTSYGYYIENRVKDYMWYIDVTVGEEKYRGVYFNEYRPDSGAKNSMTSTSYQDDNGYLLNTAYWFKYEPIEWRIVSEEGKQAFILANIVLDSQAYQNTYTILNNEAYIDSTMQAYANNYELSTIRKWLNDNFYNVAFDELEKEIINTVSVDNSAQSTGVTTNKSACANTNDKVFLLSRAEAIDSKYGFTYGFEKPDKKKQLKPTDYAKSQGVWVSTYDNDCKGNSVWLMRSPYDFRSYIVGQVNRDGTVDYLARSYNTHYGIVPAMQISL